jgi:hypothetical protein
LLHGIYELSELSDDRFIEIDLVGHAAALTILLNAERANLGGEAREPLTEIREHYQHVSVGCSTETLCCIDCRARLHATRPLRGGHLSPS